MSGPITRLVPGFWPQGCAQDCILHCAMHSQHVLGRPQPSICQHVRSLTCCHATGGQHCQGPAAAGACRGTGPAGSAAVRCCICAGLARPADGRSAVRPALLALLHMPACKVGSAGHQHRCFPVTAGACAWRIKTQHSDRHAVMEAGSPASRPCLFALPVPGC